MNVLSKIEDFYNQYKGEKFSIGKSFLGREIYCFKVSFCSYPKVICQYSIHAREHITALLALEQIKSYIKNGKVGTVYFIPALNPDGIVIAETKNALYKANARGVDLNVNFDARWSKGKTNQFIEGSENYVGKFAFSEPETRAIRDFTLKIRPQATISYHAKGEEIYYEFFQESQRKIRDYRLAKTVADCTGYKIKSTPNSCGGYKDWCIQELNIPALTIEVAPDELSHPIGEENLADIFYKNQNVLPCVMQFLKDEYERKIYEKGD